ncbi:unnamed protein product, partial [Rangifer tarandus platyrhynchus]
RGSRSYIEKSRGRREIKLTRTRRGGIKRGESNLASNQIPTCSSQPGISREVHRVTMRREEGGRRWRSPGEEGGAQKERDRSSHTQPKAFKKEIAPIPHTSSESRESRGTGSNSSQ